MINRPGWLTILLLTLTLAMMNGRSDAFACDRPYSLQAFERFDEGSKHPAIGELLVAGIARGKVFQNGDCVVPMTAWLRSMVQSDRPDILLLGEVHDNPIHHAYRSLWIDSAMTILNRLPHERAPALVSEHIRADQQPALDRFHLSRRSLGASVTSNDLFRLLDWDTSGWPPQRLFEPLFAAAIGAGLQILPGDPPKGKVRGVARGGFDVVPPDDRLRMRLDTPLPAPLAADLARELKSSHCGMLPDSAIPGMSRSQYFRDAHLADALLTATHEHGSAILIAGNGHVRTDRGVAWHLKQRAPEKKVISVMLLEVEDGENDPQAYLVRDPNGKPAADYVILTPRVGREDPCIQMRKSSDKR